MPGSSSHQCVRNLIAHVARSSAAVISPTNLRRRPSTSLSPIRQRQRQRSTLTTTNMCQFLRMAFQRLFLLKDISKASHRALSSSLTSSEEESWMLEVGEVMEACGCCGPASYNGNRYPQNSTRWLLHSTMSPPPAPTPIAHQTKCINLLRHRFALR